LLYFKNTRIVYGNKVTTRQWRVKTNDVVALNESKSTHCYSIYDH